MDVNFFSIFLWIMFFIFIASEFYFMTLSWIGWLFLPGFIIFDLIFFGLAAFVTFGSSPSRKVVE